MIAAQRFRPDARTNSPINGMEKKRHRQENDDVDQITQPPRSTTSFGCLNVAFCHSLEIMISA
jgi:hypothetical protein